MEKSLDFKTKKVWKKPEVQVLKVNSDTENGMGMGMEMITIMMGMINVSNGS